jgi:hypothetical protein
VLQREPRPGAEGRFIVAAKATGQAQARCRAVTVDPRGRITLPGGAAVTVTRRPASIDHHEGGAARRFIPYVFTAPRCSAPGKTTIVHAIGK